MSEKEPKDQPVDAARRVETTSARGAGGKATAKSKEDRLAEALRANLRRRKSAAKSRKDD